MTITLTTVAKAVFLITIFFQIILLWIEGFDSSTQLSLSGANLFLLFSIHQLKVEKENSRR